MVRSWNPNLDILNAATEALAPVLDRLVFVGGCAAGLLITDPAAPALRATHDVDAVVQAAAWIEYDLEDLFAVLDGRPTIAEEVRAADESLRKHLAAEFRRLLEDARFREAMPGHLPSDSSSQDRVPMVIERMESIARLA